MTSHLLDIPKKPRALLVLAHGAGAGMEHPFMKSLAEALKIRGIATLRFQFPYMDKGAKRPDPPAVAVATIASAVDLAAKKFPKLPIFAGGKSFGGRMTTTAASQDKIPKVRGIVCFGFPLHPPKAPSEKRAEHLEKVNVPTLFIQGTRDSLADLALIKKVVKKHRRFVRLHVVEGGDHSFNVLKKANRTKEEIYSELTETTVKFIESVSPLSAG